MTLTQGDFERLKARGWSGCMHDSDCADSNERQAEDDRILTEYAEGQRRLDGIVDREVDAFLERLDNAIRDKWPDKQVLDTLARRVDMEEGWIEWTSEEENSANPPTV